MIKKNLVVIVTTFALICAVVYAKKEFKILLPKAVKSSVKMLFPDSEIKKAEMEKLCIKLYEIKLDANDVEIEVLLGEDGTVIAIAFEAKTLPDAVEKAAASKGKIVRAEKKVVHAMQKLVKLGTPKTKYKVKVEKKGKTTEYKISEDGKTVEEVKEKKECDKDKD